jgi:hypothetical protein
VEAAVKTLIALAALGAAACPWVDALEIRAPSRFRPGEPVPVRAELRLPPGGPWTGRLHVALRLPAGWNAEGRYEISGQARALHPAPVVAERYEARMPSPGARWVAFVSHLHTDVHSGADLRAELILTPPRGAGDAAIEIAAGPAPSYPGWRQVRRPFRSLLLRPISALPLTLPRGRR